MSEHLPDVKAVPSKDLLDKLEKLSGLCRIHGMWINISDVSDDKGEVKRVMALAYEEIERLGQFIESEWFNRVTYKQQARAAQDKQSEVRAKLEEALAQWECPDVRGAIQEAIEIIDGQGAPQTTGEAPAFQVGDKVIIKPSTNAPRFSLVRGIISGPLAEYEYFDDEGQLAGKRLAYKVMANGQEVCAPPEMLMKRGDSP